MLPLVEIESRGKVEARMDRDGMVLERTLRFRIADGLSTTMSHEGESCV